MATIIDGNKTAKAVKAQTQEMVARMAEATGVKPGLAVVLVGDDPASLSYVTMKSRDAKEIGIESLDYRLGADITQDELNLLIDTLNADEAVHGILVQMPLPKHLDEEQVIERISPEKDVDGFHPYNMGSLLRGLDGPRACTPWGVMRLLEEYAIAVKGKHAVVIGRSNIVGKPQALMLLEQHATVTICHSRTENLAEICREADILIAAVGRARMVGAEYVKPGAAVIDVGINRGEDGLIGDVDFDAVEPTASAITPVPGGVGPMTRAVLMQNTVEACARQIGYALN